MTTLLAVAVLLAVPLAWTAVRRPSTLRIAARNLMRRRSEALLVTGGAMLGTAIIAASMVTGDVIDASIRSGADNFLGPIDVSVRTTDTGDLAGWEGQAAALASPEVDGLLPWIETTGSVVVDGVGEAGVPLVEVDLDAALAFGGDPAATGLDSLDGLAAGEVVLARDLAATLGVAAGDTVTVHAFGQARELTVAAALPRTGLVGYGQVLTAPGTITSMAGDPAAPGLFGELLVSTTGGVRDAAAPSEQLLAELRAIAESGERPGEPVVVQAIKQDLLRDAAATGTEFTTLFSGIGSFAVIAGVLLLVNLFVMLAEERRRDLGTLRALGMRRGLLARTFALEGAMYAAAAAVVGVVVGAALGVGIAAVAGSIFAITEGGLSFRPVLDVSSLVTAGLLGFVISLSTAWVLSLRISRANIIRSLRELPEPPRTHRVRTWVLSGLGIVGGVALTVLGVSSEVAEAIIAGLPLALLSAVPVLRRFVKVEAAMAVAGLGAVAWALAATTVWADAFAQAEITVFVVQGVVLTAGAVTALVAADRAWKWGSDVVAARTGGIAGRLGTAYPLARRARTALLLGMFAIVVFTMTFIAAMDGVFAAQTDDFAADAGGGWELLVTAPASSTDAAAALAGAEGVTAVAPLGRGFVEVVAPGSGEGAGWAITTFDESLLQVTPPVLGDRAVDYATDEEAYAAVLADPTLVIVDDSFGHDAATGSVPGVGDQVVLQASDGSRRGTFEVVGVLAADMAFNGGFASAKAVDGIARPGGQQRFHVAVDGDATAIASALDGQYVALGIDASAYLDLVAEEMAEQSSFFKLLQVFLGLGLVIGVAGVGVVLVRAVGERTRQVGTLRAIGVRRATVARAFLVEAGFIAVQGVVIGATLGLVSAWQVLTRTDAFGQMDLAFSVPWVAVAVITLVPLAAAVAMTAMPARRAASIRPAVALRVGD